MLIFSERLAYIVLCKRTISFFNFIREVFLLKRSDVAVLGAGITGLSIAWHLLQRGVKSVTLYEKAGVGAGATAVAPGGVRLQWGTRVNCEMSRESLDFFQQINERLDPKRPVVFRSTGYLFLAYSDSALKQLSANVALQHEYDIPSRLVEAHELHDIVPSLATDGAVGGSYCPLDGYFDDPQAVVAAFAEAVTRAGVKIVQEEVVGLEPRAGGWRMALRSGGVAEAEHVAVATGYDTPALLQSLDVALNIQRVSRWLFYSEPLDQRVVEPLVISSRSGLAIRQTAGGAIMMGWLDDRVGRDGQKPDEAAWLRRAAEAASRLIPALAGTKFVRAVPGAYDVTPDYQAVLGPVPGFERLWLAVGTSGHGFMIAPAVGRRIAALIAGDEPDEAVKTLAFERFETGKLVPEPQVI